MRMMKKVLGMADRTGAVCFSAGWLRQHARRSPVSCLLQALRQRALQALFVSETDIRSGG